MSLLIPSSQGCQAILEDLIEEYETILAATAVGVACFEVSVQIFDLILSDISEFLDTKCSFLLKMI